MPEFPRDQLPSEAKRTVNRFERFILTLLILCLAGISFYSIHTLGEKPHVVFFPMTPSNSKP